ncbi:hypothetical protein GCWU000341_02599 [Oribacterium sp. oral taxon 078 str. F0262]|nr:hypothetical protein GCWU000341_02599 [Oribacterium sp. oral taxon 078 str. F0262]
MELPDRSAAFPPFIEDGEGFALLGAGSAAGAACFRWEKGRAI